MPTPRKTRFIEADRSQRIFELTELRSDQWNKSSSAHFCKSISRLDGTKDAHIVADFGHGLFEKEVLQTLSDFKSFIGLNVQTNSSNYGFNPFTKHKRYSFLSIDTKEARIAYHDRHSSPFDLATKIRSDLGSRGVSFAMTLGGDGAYYFPRAGKELLIAPAFADTVVDATGAGDAFFGITALLEKVDCPAPMIPFLGSIFAGLKTKIIGNKSQVPKAQLMKAVHTVLK